MGSASIRPLPVVVGRRAAALKQQQPCCVWLTGCPGLASRPWPTLSAAQRAGAAYLLDGDNLRTGLCNDLGMSDAARKENIRRIGEVAR
jgi:adenylylsulfate kinase